MIGIFGVVNIWLVYFWDSGETFLRANCSALNRYHVREELTKTSLDIFPLDVFPCGCIFRAAVERWVSVLPCSRPGRSFGQEGRDARKRIREAWALHSTPPLPLNADAVLAYMQENIPNSIVRPHETSLLQAIR